jgi:hypothetical protein
MGYHSAFLASFFWRLEFSSVGRFFLSSFVHSLTLGGVVVVLWSLEGGCYAVAGVHKSYAMRNDCAHAHFFGRSAGVLPDTDLGGKIQLATEQA